MINLKVTNLKQLQKRFKNSPRKLRRQMELAVKSAGEEAVDRTKHVISTGRSMWKSPVDTGRMRSGIFVRSKGLTATVRPSTRTPYSVYVHEGTNKMTERPFFTITEKTEARSIQGAFNKALNIKKII